MSAFILLAAIVSFGVMGAGMFKIMVSYGDPAPSLHGGFSRWPLWAAGGGALALAFFIGLGVGHG
jgi:hypothetical protein